MDYNRGTKSGFRVLIGLLSILKPLSHMMVLCILLGVLGFFCAISITVLGVHILLAYNNISPFEFGVGLSVVLLVLAAVFRAVFRYAEQMTGHYIAFKLLAIIRDKVFRAMRRLAPAKLETRNRGDLISIITSDIELLEVFYAHTVAPVVVAIIVSLSMSAINFHIHWRFGVATVMAFVMVGYMVPVYTADIGKKQASEYRKELGVLNSYFLESVRGIRESIQFGSTESRQETIDNQTGSINALHRKITLHEGITSAVSSAIVMIFPVILIAIGYINRISAGSTIMAAVVLAASFGPVFALSNLSSVLTKTIASARRVLALLEEEEETEDVLGGETPVYDGMAVRNLSFGYERETVLEDVSMTFDKQSVVGITGASGTGKTTLLKLMMRFWNAPKDAIQMSGVCVSDINTEHLRKNQSFMTQQTDLFQGTIAENIKIAKKDASREEVEEAAKKASIHEFIMSLPKGYSTKVGELGETLSGGERQRIGLARVFLHDAPLVLLDEPTSNLDSLNEAVIFSSLKKYSEDSTVVMVSHRQSALSIAEKVYNIETIRHS